MNTSTPDIYFQLIKMLPKGMRDDVMKVYQFFHLALDYASIAHIDIEPLDDLISDWRKAKKAASTASMKEGETDSKTAARHMSYIVHRYKCDPKWVDTYLKALKSHISQQFVVAADQEAYMLRTSGVIGYIMGKVVGVKDSHIEHAAVVAVAFQQLAYIRNSGEDSLNDRTNFAREDIVMHGLKKLDSIEAVKKQAEFREFIEQQVARYYSFRDQGSGLRRYVPLRVRGVLGTAISAHDWIAAHIADNPLIVFEQKVTPSKLRMGYTRTIKRLSV